jgi:hypothetical protein
VRLRELRELGLVAADQDRIGHHRVAVLERDAALRADGEDRADQMLVRAHAPADAVHDDAEPLLRHFSVALSRVPGAAQREARQRVVVRCRTGTVSVRGGRISGAPLHFVSRCPHPGHVG